MSPISEQLLVTFVVIIAFLMLLAFYLTWEEFKKMAKNPEKYQEKGHEEQLKRARPKKKRKTNVK